MTNPYIDVMRILTSETHNLKKLAEMTSFDPVYFYQGADLREVDLTGQDLRGLNFARADLRGATIEEIEFDDGAFNGAKLDEEDQVLTDGYDMYLEDITPHYFSYISCHYRFRRGFVDELLKSFNVYYKEFARRAHTSSGTLQRVRQGYAVANETIFGIVDEVRKMVANPPKNRDARRVAEKSKQPQIQVGFYKGSGAWSPLKRREFEEIFSKLEFVNGVRYGVNWRNDAPPYMWNSKPSTIRWAYDYYRKYPELSRHLTDEEMADLIRLRSDDDSSDLNQLPLFRGDQ